jgi:glycosyltransferase involved in cell wall biosynthesis
MKFVFIEAFKSNDVVNWNGKTARTTNGVSGSHWALIYLAEAFASQCDNVVEFVSIENNLVEGSHLGVQYINYINYSDTDDDSVCCDKYLVTVHELNAMNIMEKIKGFKKLFFLMQNDLLDTTTEGKCSKVFNGIDINKVVICYISDFARRNILNVQPFLNNYHNMILYNSIDMRDVVVSGNDVNNVIEMKKDRKLCFFACVDRGLEMVVELLKRLDNYYLVTNTYYAKNTKILKNSNIVRTENTGKYSIFKHISTSRYFVYPLINLENNRIHYDTFAYVVLEALLHGTIVIAPRIGVFEELYGDAICYIDTDDLISPEYLQNWKNMNYRFGFPCLEKYVNKIKMLDENVELRMSYIEKGYKLREKFSNMSIKDEFFEKVSLMDKIIQQQQQTLKN